MAIRASNASVLSVVLPAAASAVVGILVGRYACPAAQPRATPSASVAAVGFDGIAVRLERLEEQLASFEANEAQSLQTLSAEIRRRPDLAVPMSPPAASHVQPRDDSEPAAPNPETKATLDRIETLLAETTAKKQLDEAGMAEFRALFARLPSPQRVQQRARLYGLINSQQVATSQNVPFF